MIVVANNAGLGNKLKNVVSALRKGHLTNDTVHVNFDHQHLFTYVQCVDRPKQEVEMMSTWRLELLDSDREKPILVAPNDMLIIHDKNQYHIDHEMIDFQYDNISPVLRDNFIQYFMLIHFNPLITEGVSRFCSEHDIADKVGVHIRTWADAPDRYNLLHDIDIFIESMDQRDGSGFFVSADHESALQILKSRYGNRIISAPKASIQHVALSNDPQTAVDSLVDMLILSKCKSIIGTYQSTFTECAWWLGGATCPVEITVPPHVKHTLQNLPSLQ